MSGRPSERPANDASRTLTVTSTPSHPDENEAGPSQPIGVLKLKGGPTRKQRVVWSEETVDNEGMGKKKSKICCIYHKPRAYDESSSESDSSCDDDPSQGRNPRSKGQKLKKRDGSKGNSEEQSSSESEGGGGDGKARPLIKPSRRKHKHQHDCGDHDHDHQHSAKPNKYDVQPRNESPGKAG